MQYRPELDGLRALAVLAVVCAHTQTPLVGGGRGVDVFFVLSGFLITTILLHGPQLSDFYIRRARRLLPALAVFLAAYVLLAPLLLPKDDPIREALFALFYSNNWSMALDFRESGLAHTWSLSVEEQFYILWPLVLIALRKTAIPLWWLAAAWFLLTALRIMWPDQAAAYYITPLHATGLILGAMVAIKPPSARFGWVSLSALLLCFTQAPGEVWSIPLTEVATVFLISALLKPSRLSSAFARPPAVWVGLISYGVYLWHWPIALLTRDQWWSLPFTLALAIPLAALSWFTVEAWARSRTDYERGNAALGTVKPVSDS